MDQALLEIVVCPNCKGRLKLSQDSQELICRFDHIAYPIKDDMPLLMVNEARKLKEGEE